MIVIPPSIIGPNSSPRPSLLRSGLVQPDLWTQSACRFVLPRFVLPRTKTPSPSGRRPESGKPCTDPATRDHLSHSADGTARRAPSIVTASSDPSRRRHAGAARCGSGSASSRNRADRRATACGRRRSPPQTHRSQLVCGRRQRVGYPAPFPFPAAASESQ